MYWFPEKFSDPRRKDGSLVYLRLVVSVFYFLYLFFKDVSVRKGEPRFISFKESDRIFFFFTWKVFIFSVSIYSCSGSDLY